MANYVCSELSPMIEGHQTCLSWVEYQSSVDMLAITGDQRDMILLASLTVIFSTWCIRQVINVILQRRY